MATDDDRAALVGAYLEYFNRELEAESVGNWVELTTPFLDRHNDAIQIYARKVDGAEGFEITDDGFAFVDLAESGVDLTPQRNELIDLALRNLGIVRASDGRLAAIVATDVLGEALHRMVQAVIAVTDMHVLAQTRVRSIFIEDVAHWLTDDVGVAYTRDERIQGKAYPHTFDFVLGRTNGTPMRIIQAASNPTRQVVEDELWRVEDLRQAEIEFSPFVVLNDNEISVPQETIDALDRYNVQPVVWSERSQFNEILAGTES